MKLVHKWRTKYSNVRRIVCTQDIVFAKAPNVSFFWAYVTCPRCKSHMGVKSDYERGVRAAASIADQYNSSSSHHYRLGDCILGKLNMLKKQKIRKNKERITK